MCEAVVQMFNRLSNAPNRKILYDLYDYICDIKSGVGLARAYVKTLGNKKTPSVLPIVNNTKVNVAGCVSLLFVA